MIYIEFGVRDQALPVELGLKMGVVAIGAHPGPIRERIAVQAWPMSTQAWATPAWTWAAVTMTVQADGVDRVGPSDRIAGNWRVLPPHRITVTEAGHMVRVVMRGIDHRRRGDSASRIKVRHRMVVLMADLFRSRGRLSHPVWQQVGLALNRYSF